MVWRPRIRIGAGSKFMGIVEAIEEDVAAGAVAPGERMPAQRSVAAALGIDLGTVTRAYGEAKLRGVLQASPGRGGTRVAADAPQAAERALVRPVDLSLNIPPQPARADLAGRLARTTADVLRGGAGLLQYGPVAGAEADRVAGAYRLGRIIGPVDPGRVVVASGAQASLFAIFAAILGPGERIGTGVVAYPGAKAAAERVGAAIVPLAMDAEGVLPEAVAAACRSGGLRALYLVPTLDNPTTATMSAPRRLEIAEIARREGLAIVEDDPYGPLALDPPAPIAASAPERTWYVATLAKCATPGLRIAHVAAPTARAADTLGAALRATTLMAPPLAAAVATRWIADGTLAKIVAAIREESAARQELAAAALAGHPFRAGPRGPHVWLELPPGRRADGFAAEAGSCGVAVVPASAFATGPAAPDAVRVSLGAAPDRASLRIGLKRLAGLLGTDVRSRAVV